MNNTMKIALKLAEENIPVFPCHANKAPACPGGFKAASTYPDQIKKLWSKYPGELIGVPTGIVSGFDVLDIDPRHGGNEWLEANSNLLPVTRTHRTVSGGYHLIFNHCDGIRNSAGKIAPGIDIRGDGGYIIWWPTAELEVTNSDIIAQWSDWLLKLIFPVPEKNLANPTASLNISTAYAKAALRRAAEKISSAAEGKRNDTLNSECWSILRFVEAGILPAENVTSILAAAALNAGLPREEIIGTISSSLNKRNI